MAIIDVVKWDAAPGVFAWKYPSSSLSSWTQLIVSESQEALMLKEGRAVGPFAAGRHVLSPENYPLLGTLLKIPFGKTPYTAEVWFVQKAFKLNIRWGTSDPIQLEDPQYRIMLPVRAFGQYGVTVADTSKFVIKMVGTLPALTEKTLTEYFKGIITTRSKDIIAKYLVEKKISILHVSSRLNEISAALQEQISAEIAEYGLKIVNFNVNSISTNDSDPAVIKLKEALAARAEMDIMGFNYQQKRSFDTMQAAAENTGSGSTLMNAGIGLGVGMGMGGAMGGAAQQMTSNLSPNGTPCPKCRHPNDAQARFCSKCATPLDVAEEKKSVAGIKCDKCGHVGKPGMKFCPECGDIFNLCPKCGADNPDHASVCEQCGAEYPFKCPGCQAMVSRSLKFCGECGNPLHAKCPSCGESHAFGVKFCGSCGTKMEGI